MVQLIPIKSKLSEFESITISFETSICYKLKKKKYSKHLKSAVFLFQNDFFFFYTHHSSFLSLQCWLQYTTAWLEPTGSPDEDSSYQQWWKRKRAGRCSQNLGQWNYWKRKFNIFFSIDKKVNFLYLTTNLWWKEACMDWFYSLSQIHQRKK